VKHYYLSIIQTCINF